MFTGIIQFVFPIRVDLENKIIYVYGNKEFLNSLKIGCSIAVDGVCLTVVEIAENYCTFNITEETISKTILQYSPKYSNIEPALKVGDPLDGHIVSGHVFKIGTILSFSGENLWIKLEEEDMDKVFYKGSIAINGISLTIAEVRENAIRIAIIPETLKRTTFQYYTTEGITHVNIEFDSTPNLSIKDDSYYMRLALREAEKGRYTTAPNPHVGCVIVFENNIISKGFHFKAGEDHAEVVAINSCKYPLNGSTLYCTLEPCAHLETACYPDECVHEGECPLGTRSLSCSEVIISKKISRVVVGIVDPDKRVAGRGIQKLKEAGIEVELISNKKLQQEINFSMRQYIYHRKTGLPYVTLKIALSADGCYREGNDFEKWITHAGSRQEVYKLWAESEAVILGAGTIQKDNPEINPNDSKSLEIPNEEWNIPFHFKKIVIDGASLTSTNHRIFSNPNPLQNAKVVTDNPGKWKETNVSLISVKNTRDISEILSKLDVVQCLVEGGGILHRSFAESGFTNEIVIFRGSKIFGNQGYHWNIPKLKVDLIEAKEIEYNGGKNIMERYLVEPSSERLETKEIAFDDVDVAISEFSKGGMVLVMDDESRENEGDLIVAASKITEYQMTEMINSTTGIICTPMDVKRAKQLNLNHLEEKNGDKHGTAWTNTVDHKDTSTGVSSKDRLLTVHALADPKTLPTDLNRPGHVFPLIANSGGLNARRGHTECAITLCELANIYPRVAVIGELKNKDGTMKRKGECFLYAKNNSIPIISVQQLVDKINSIDRPKLLSSNTLKTKFGKEKWKQLHFDSGNPLANHLVFLYPSDLCEKEIEKVIPLRIHSECFTGDVFHSEECDCGPQKDQAMEYIVNRGYGAIIFPADHEGRGIGRCNKSKAYDLKERMGFSTFEANRKLGFPDDARTYDDIPRILDKIGIKKVELLTENPDKISCLGDRVVRNSPVLTEINEYNEKYLFDKRKLFDHREEYMNKQFPEVDDISRNEKFRVGIIYASWHEEYITRIRLKFKKELNILGITQIEEYDVPGSGELSFMASSLAKTGKYDGLIIIGILLKGETFHMESVSMSVSINIGIIRDKYEIPIINGLLSCLNYEQVEDRISGKKSTIEYQSRSLIKLILDLKKIKYFPG